jgi:peptide/nickel transport system substrate-binding protein
MCLFVRIFAGVFLAFLFNAMKYKSILAYFLCIASLLALPGMAEKNILLADELPASGGSIILGTIGEPSNLLPYMASDASSSEVSGLLHTSLLEYDKDLNIIDCAAESHEIGEGGRLMRFKIRDGILWEDGEPLTAADVEFTYKLMIDPKTPTAYAADFLMIKEFKVTGRLSFEVRYDTPYARSMLTWLQPILPKHALERENIASTRYSRRPLSSGPYVLEEWSPGSKITLRANGRYFKGRPYIDKVIYRVIPDGTTMFLEAKAGKLDYISLSPMQFLRQTEGDKWSASWKKYRFLAGVYTYVGLNLKHPFFRDKKVRQALSYAIDRNAIVKGALLGMGEAAFGPYKPGTWAYDAALHPYPYDPRKAMDLLASAGWTMGKDGVLVKDGTPFEFTVLVNQGNDERIKVAVILQQYFRKIGIRIKIRIVEWAAFIKEFVNTKKFDALILGWTISQDPDLYEVWHSSAISGHGLNFISYSNPEVDRLLEEARVEQQQAERKKMYDRFQEILHEDQPYLFLYVPYSLPMVHASVKGITPAPAGITYNFERWWISKTRHQQEML